MLRIVLYGLGLAGLSLALLGGLLLAQRQSASAAYWLLIDDTGQIPNRPAYATHLPDGTPWRSLPGVNGVFLDWSPDGYTLFFGGRQAVWRVGVAGQDAQAIIPANGGAYFINPVVMRLAPDGRWYAVKVPVTRFVSTLYLMRPDGRQAVELTQENGLEILSLGWADAHTVRYSVRRSQGEVFYEMDIHQRIPHPVDAPPRRVLAPDGQAVLEHANGSTWTLDTGENATSFVLPESHTDIINWLPGDWLLTAMLESDGAVQYSLVSVHAPQRAYPVWHTHDDELVIGHLDIAPDDPYLYFSVIQRASARLYRVDPRRDFQRETVLDSYTAVFGLRNSATGLLWAAPTKQLIFRTTENRFLQYAAASPDGHNRQVLFRTPGPASRLLLQLSPDGRFLLLSYLDARPLRTERRHVVGVNLAERAAQPIGGPHLELKGTSPLIDLPVQLGCLVLAGLGLVLGAGAIWWRR